MLRDAAALGLMDAGHVWIVSEEALPSSTMKILNLSEGSINLEQTQTTDKRIKTKQFNRENIIETVSNLSNYYSLPPGLLLVTLQQRGDEKAHITDAL